MTTTSMNNPILYIHGFASSGHSNKVSILRKRFDRVIAPSLNHIPPLAIETLAAFIPELRTPPLLVGSSLGGFYALYLSQQFDLPAVLINPVTRFDLPLQQVVGFNQHYFDGSRFEFTETHLNSLRDYQPEQVTQDRLLLLLQLGDELIDQRQTREFLPAARARIEQNGNHEYQHFESALELIADFGREMFG